MGLDQALQTIAQRMPLKILIAAAIALLTLLSLLALIEIAVVLYAMHSGNQISAALLYGKIDMKERTTLEQQKCSGIGDGLNKLAEAINKITETEYKQLGDMRVKLDHTRIAVRTFINDDKPTQATNVDRSQVQPMIEEVRIRQETLDKSVQSIHKTVNDAVQACISFKKSTT